MELTLPEKLLEKLFFAIDVTLVTIEVNNYLSLFYVFLSFTPNLVQIILLSPNFMTLPFSDFDFLYFC